MKQKILYLCHRIPFPPNKGDKITTYNILKFLHQHYDVYLGCFIDDTFDNQYQDDVRQYCKEAFFVQINPKVAKIKGLSAFITGKPITLPHYYDQKLQNWVNRTVIEQKLEKALIYSGCMAQYVMNPICSDLHKVMHFADIDSDKWSQYAEKTQGIMSWVYRREHRTLEQFEKRVAREFAISCFISDTETAMFQDMVEKQDKNKIQTLANGIDTGFFSPDAETTLDEDYPLKDDNYIVFTGAMGYWANIDAVVWFVEKVWPHVRQQIKDCKFYIVGSSAPKQVINLQDVPGIVVTGRVEDVRPYLLHSKASVAPMQIARGIQNKILEAMAMEKPVITTQLGMEGLEDYPSEGASVSNLETDIAKWTIERLTEDMVSVPVSREWLQNNYSWEAKLSPLLNYLENTCD